MPWALAPIPAVFIGLMAILLIYGTIALLNVLARSLDNLLGANWFERGLAHVWTAINNALNAVGDWFDGMLADIANFFIAIPSALYDLSNWAAEGLRRVADAARYTLRVLLPQLVHDLLADISAVYSWASRWVSGLINDVYNWATRQISALSAWITGLYNNIVGWVTNLYNNIVNWVTGLYNNIIGWVNRLYNDIVNWVNGIRNDIIRWVGTQVDDIVNWATGVVANAVTYAINT